MARPCWVLPPVNAMPALPDLAFRRMVVKIPHLVRPCLPALAHLKLSWAWVLTMNPQSPLLPATVLPRVLPAIQWCGPAMQPAAGAARRIQKRNIVPRAVLLLLLVMASNCELTGQRKYNIGLLNTVKPRLRPGFFHAWAFTSNQLLSAQGAATIPATPPAEHLIITPLTHGTQPACCIPHPAPAGAIGCVLQYSQSTMGENARTP